MTLTGIPLPDWYTSRQTFRFRDHDIAYWHAGQGEPLLLIHGFPTASWDWHYQWQALADQYHVIACDMLGFGYSDKPRRHTYSLIEQADLQQALLLQLGIVEPIHILAHDYGDSVAQELLARHEEGRSSIASCALLNGGLFPETHHALLIQKLLLSPIGALFSRLFNQARMNKAFRSLFGPQTQPNESELNDFWQLVAYNDGPAVMHRLIHYISDRREHRDRWVGALQKTSVPLRLIDGGADPVSGVHMLDRYRELIPNPDTVLLEKIGHYPQIEAPAEVLHHYLDFRNQLSLSVPSSEPVLSTDSKDAQLSDR